MAHSASSKMKPFMTYLGESEYAMLRKFSKRQKVPMAQVIREAVAARVAPGDRYVCGHNAAIKAVIAATNKTQAAQMRFPSGQSFGELMTAEFEKMMLKEDSK